MIGFLSSLLRALRLAAATVLAALVLIGAAPALAQYDYDYDDYDYEGYYYDDDYYDDDWYYDYYDADDWGADDLSDLEYEPDEGLHQEEWYDPSDWFDTTPGISYEDMDEYDYYDDEVYYY